MSLENKKSIIKTMILTVAVLVFTFYLGKDCAKYDQKHQKNISISK